MPLSVWAARFFVMGVMVHAGATALAAPPTDRDWTEGMKVEVKRGTVWWEATVAKKDFGWVLVTHKSNGWKEWVEPWRIRKAGSKEDKIGNVNPQPMRSTEGEHPTGFPGPAPEGKIEPTGKLVKSGEGPAAKRFGPTDWRRMDTKWNGKWAVVPDAAPAPAQPAPASISLKVFDQSGEKKEVAASLGEKPVMWICHTLRPSGSLETSVKLERVDVAGKSSEVFPISPDRAMVDASPDGKSVMFKPIPGGTKLEVWSQAGGKLAPAAELDVFQEVGILDAAWFTPDGNVFVLDASGRMALWNPKTGAFVYRAHAEGHGYMKPAMSPTRKYVALARKDTVALFEVKTGKCVGEMPRVSSGAEMHFSPSGKQLAAFGGYGVEAWDLATGKPWRQFMIDAPPKSSVAFPVDGYLLVGGQLVDLEKRVAIWNYNGLAGNPGTVLQAGSYTYAASMSLTTVKVAGDAELAVSKGINAEEILLLKPGMKVSVEVSVPGADGEKVKDALMKSLARSGLEVAEGQRVKFVARTGEGKREEKKYNVIGGPIDPANPTAQNIQTATSVEQISVFALEVDGKVVWERKKSKQPDVFRLEKGQTVAGAMEQLSKPGMENLLVAWMPAYWVKPGAVVAGK